MNQLDLIHRLRKLEQYADQKEKELAQRYADYKGHESDYRYEGSITDSTLHDKFNNIRNLRVGNDNDSFAVLNEFNKLKGNNTWAQADIKMFKESLDLIEEEINNFVAQYIAQYPLPNED